MTAPAIPRTLEEFEEEMHDFGKVRAKMADGTWPDYLAAYATKFFENDRDVLAQVKEQNQAVLAELVREGRVDRNRLPLGPTAGYDSPEARVAAIKSPQNKHGLYSKTAPGAALNGVADSFADYLRSLAPQAGTYRDHAKLAQVKNKVMEVTNSFSTNAPSDGGFLVPEEFRSDLMMLTLESEIVAPRATVIPMSTQRVTIPAVDSTTNATSVFGGIVCYWVDEATAPTESNAKFAAITLDTKKLMLYATAPNELVADSPAFGAFANRAFPGAMAFERDYKYIQGTGVGEPLGWSGSQNPAAIAVSAVSGQGANTIVVENLASMYARMLPSSLGNAVWVADIGTFPQLATMALSVGTGGAPVFLTGGSIAGAPPMTIYGRPVVFTEKCQALGSQGDISLVDLSFYLIGDRQDVTVAASQDFLFSTDRVAYRAIARTDGKPWLKSAITPKNSGSTLSPFVQLSSTRT